MSAPTPTGSNSYTQKFRDWQIVDLFKGTPYHFSHFVKTDGYANLPLDGLWLRAPYLHNGSVPTLADLLPPPAAAAEGVRARLGRDRSGQGRFHGPGLHAGRAAADRFCFDTASAATRARPRLRNRPAGGQKADLLAYLLTF